MALEEDSAVLERLKGKKFGKDFVLLSEIKSTSRDPLEVEMEVAAVVRKLMVDKAKEFANGGKLWLFFSKDGIDEIRKEKEKTSKDPVETGKAATVIDENQTVKAPLQAGKAAAAIDKIQEEKMDKPQVDDEKNMFSAVPRESPPVETGTPIDKILTEKCAESDDPPAGVNGKYRLSDEYVGSILSISRDYPDDTIPYYDRCSTLAEDMGEEWIAKQNRRHKEMAARSRRIHNEFVQFQNWVLKEWLQKGYVEVDKDYLTYADELEEYGRQLREKRGDPVYADSYVPFDPVEQARVLLSGVNLAEQVSS